VIEDLPTFGLPTMAIEVGPSSSSSSSQANHQRILFLTLLFDRLIQSQYFEHSIEHIAHAA